METEEVTSTGRLKYVPPTFEEYEIYPEGILCSSILDPDGPTEPDEGEEGGAMRGGYFDWPERRKVWK